MASRRCSTPPGTATAPMGRSPCVNVDGVRVDTAVGVADADGSPTDVGMRFRAGSITKTITAALVLDQVAQGHLGLDDDVAAIVGPPLRPTPPVTVRMLLDHTSGIFDIGNDGDPIADIAEAHRRRVCSPKSTTSSIGRRAANRSSLRLVWSSRSPRPIPGTSNQGAPSATATPTTSSPAC